MAYIIYRWQDNVAAMVGGGVYDREGWGELGRPSSSLGAGATSGCTVSGHLASSFQPTTPPAAAKAFTEEWVSGFYFL